MSETQELAAKRARLTEIDRELAGLRSQHDLAMSAFKFDEASALQGRIEALDDGAGEHGFGAAVGKAEEHP